MSRIKQCLSQKTSKALIPYITAGDPYPGLTVQLMHRLVEAGADIIELGVPFSDPMADGPVIQKAVENALAHDVSLTDVLGMVETFRKVDQTTPVVLMGYLNPIEIMGYETFTKACQRVGVDGVLTVDMPPEEATEFSQMLADVDVDRIFLMSPTTRPERIKLIAEQSSGYIYYVSLKGITGASTLDIDSVKAKLSEIRAVTSTPIGVGFGIKTAEIAAEVSKVADGVVVGSALVSQAQEIFLGREGKRGVVPSDEPAMTSAILEAVGGLLAPMRQAMDRAAD